MKIQLDYDNKTISLEDDIDLGFFVDKIKILLPDWNKWKLITNPIINWQNPYYVYPHQFTYPWWERQPTITFNGTGDANFTNDSFTHTGFVNLELVSEEEGG